MERRGIFYYVPGLQQQEVNTGATLQAKLAELGLTDRFTDPPSAICCRTGPDGTGGCVLATSPTPYSPDAQEWHKDQRFWVGWIKDLPPGPEDLAREKLIRGTSVELNDGNPWTIPIAVLQPGVRRRKDGQWVIERDPMYAELWELAEQLRESHWEPINEARQRWSEIAGPLQEELEAGGQVAPERVDGAEQVFAHLLEVCGQIDPDTTVRILAANYRIGAEEVGALGLLQADEVTGLTHDWSVLDAFVSGAGVREAAKKKETPSAAAD